MIANNGLDEETLRRVISANEPRGVRPYLAIPVFDQAYHFGTLVPRLGNFVKHSSGLFVPASSRTDAAPIDFVRTYVTQTQLTGARTSGIEEIRKFLELIPLRIGLSVVAGAMAVLRRPESGGTTGLDGQSLEHFDEPQRTKLWHILRQGSIIHAPQLLMVLAKLMVAHCPDEGSVEVAARMSLPKLLLAVADCLAGDDDDPSPQTPIPLVSDVSLEFMANDHFNSTYRHDSQLALFQRRWVEMPREQVSRHYRRPLDDAFLDATGARIGDFAAIAVALWSSCVAGTPVVECHAFLQDRGWSADRVERVLEFISKPVQYFRDEVRGWMSGRSLDWYFTPFELSPAIRFGNDLLVLDADSVLRRCLGWLPLFDIEFGLENQGRGDEARAIMRAFDDYTERYVVEAFRSMVGDARGDRVFEEHVLRSAYKRGKTADVAIDWGDAWVVVEVTRGRNLRRTAHAASTDAMLRDRDMVVAEARQVAATISAIRADERPLTGVSRKRSPTFFPIVVFAEGFTINPLMTTLVREELQREGILQGPGIAPLEIMDVADLDIVEGVAERGGSNLPHTLAMKARSSFAADAVGRFVLSHPNFDPRRPARVEKAFKRAFQDVAISMGFDPSELSRLEGQGLGGSAAA